MIIYTEKYTESDKDIQNNSLLYKIHPKHLNTFQTIPNIRKHLETNKTTKRTFQTQNLFCYIYKYHNSYFVIFVYLVTLYIPVINSTFKAIRRRSKFAVSLWIHSHFCIPNAPLGLQIGFLAWFRSEFCIAGASLVLQSRILAVDP